MTSDKKANIFRTTAWQLLCKQAWYKGYKQDLQIYVPLVTKSNNIVRIQLTEWLDHAQKNSQGSSCQTFQKEKLTSHLHGSVLIDMKNLMKMQHSVGEETKVAQTSLSNARLIKTRNVHSAQKYYSLCGIFLKIAFLYSSQLFTSQHNISHGFPCGNSGSIMQAYPNPQHR